MSPDDDTDPARIAETAARRLRAWAESCGCFSQGRGASAAPTDGFAAPSVFAGGADAAFASKPITAIGYAGSADHPARVFVYTRRRLSRAEEKRLADHDLGVPLVFAVARPLTVSSTGLDAAPMVLPADGRLACGGSIGVGNAREAGTLGAIVRDSAGRLYGLSCNHVTGGCSNARPGLPIVAPGIADVAASAPDPRTIGHHRRALPLVPGDPAAGIDPSGNLDAALFALLDPSRHSSHQSNCGDTPARVRWPREDAIVDKVGRTTGATHGLVESRLVGAARVDYHVTVHHSAEENVVFRGSVFFEPVWLVRGRDGPFALAGDSGALVVDRDRPEDPAAVGLVVGGDGDLTWVLPLPPILDRLGVSLVSGL